MNFLNTTFFQQVYFGNPLSNYFLALVTLILGLCITKIVIRRILLNWFRKKTKQTSCRWDDYICNLVEKTVVPLVELFVFYISLQFIQFPPQIDVWVDRIVFVIAVFFITKSLNSLVKESIHRFLTKQYSSQDASKNFKGLVQIVSVFVWIIASLVILDYFGIDVTALIASIGIVGLAGAMAAKGIVEDIICYFTIILDKPFEVGDYIAFGSQSGTLLTIGLASSRIRSLSGEEIVLSNSQLINDMVRNYKKMENRRISFQIGITYETPAALVESIPSTVKSIFDKIQNTSFARCHFKSFGDFSLNFEIVYFVLTNDYDEYMNVQQAINLKIMEAFQKQGIEFAYPTQLVYTQPNQSA